MKTIRGGSGLGDALYVQAVARHLVNRGERLKVCTAWPEVFKRLPVETAPFTRQGINYLAHYSARKARTDTNQFEDCCQSAGIMEPVEFRIDWKAEDRALVDSLLSRGRPIVCVQLAREPMGRADGFGRELLPNCRRIQEAINIIGTRATIVQVGAGEALYGFRGIDIDLSNKTTVSQLLDVAAVASGFLGYVSYLVPLAETFSKPGLFIWSRRGLKAGHPYLRQITPQKILHRDTSLSIVDDCSPDALKEITERFMGLCAS